jgi:hypothetical protein
MTQQFDYSKGIIGGAQALLACGLIGPLILCQSLSFGLADEVA